MASADRDSPASGAADAARDFERTLSKLESAPAFARGGHQVRLFAAAMKLLKTPEGVRALLDFAPRFDAAGVFDGGDWVDPDRLQPVLVRATLLDDGPSFPVECLSELRMLAVACGEATHPELTADEARAFLGQVLARNLDLLFPEATEAVRAHARILRRVQNLFELLVERLGTEDILVSLVDECDRLMRQRPIIIRRVERMLRAAALALPANETAALQVARSATHVQARWMIEALDGPTELSRRAREPSAYRAELTRLDAAALAEEARALGERMDQSGLVSPQHATLLGLLVEAAPDLLAGALALDDAGRASLSQHAELVHALIRQAVEPETARCIYGLSRLLNRAILSSPAVARGLRALMALPIAEVVQAQLMQARPGSGAVAARTLLMSGTLSVLGQPLGVDQGHNPTCQAARAISLWSQHDPGYLLELIATAAAEGDLTMHFEGEAIRASEVGAGLVAELHTELDPVSLLLTPHLDRIYMEMSRRTASRAGDGHRWVNPEFHGAFVYRDFASLIDASTRAIVELEAFVRTFYASYHPDHNGGRPLDHAQPCGVVSTTAHAHFVGWHAISIQRVERDPGGDFRVYFFNPNRDKGQDWGHGVVTSTHGRGEREGESSLPFEQFAMRLYVFHYRQEALGDAASVPASWIEEIRAGVAASWGAGFAWS